jgi:hypothetical protein
MAMLTDEQQAVVGTIAATCVSTYRTGLTRVMGVNFDRHTGLPTTLVLPTFADSCQVFQSNEGVWVLLHNALTHDMIGVLLQPSLSSTDGDQSPRCRTSAFPLQTFSQPCVVVGLGNNTFARIECTIPSRSASDTPPPLKRRGFSLLASYTGLWPKPQACGRCHHANYWVGLTQILSPDVDRSHPVAVIDEPASLVRAAEHAPRDLAPHVQALRASAGRIGFLLQGDANSQELRFVGELEAHAAMRPLVDFLVVGVTNIGLLPEIAHIANDQRSDASLIERRYQARGLLVFDLLDLMLNLLELFLL